MGYAELYPENDQTMLRRNGIPMVAVMAIPQPGSNQIAITDEFNKRMKLYQNDLPKDLKISTGFDNSVFIQASISEVEDTIIEAFVLVVVVIFLFLRDWRSTLIPVVAIPVSLVGIFFVMYLHGLLHQRAHAAGHCAGHQPGGGRCHCGAGKHLQPD